MRTLYDKSRDAMRRYWKREQAPISKLGRAFQVAKHEAFRTGWIIGYRAGKRAALRQGNTP